jgi:hypothetical protein
MNTPRGRSWHSFMKQMYICSFVRMWEGPCWKKISKISQRLLYKYFCLFLINTQTMYIKSSRRNDIVMFSPLYVIPRWDLNPGLLFLRRMRWPPRHAAVVCDWLLFVVHRKQAETWIPKASFYSICSPLAVNSNLLGMNTFTPPPGVNTFYVFE